MIWFDFQSIPSSCTRRSRSNTGTGDTRQEQEVSAKIETESGSWNDTGDGIECIVGRLWNEEQYVLNTEKERKRSGVIGLISWAPGLHGNCEEATQDATEMAREDACKTKWAINRPWLEDQSSWKIWVEKTAVAFSMKMSIQKNRKGGRMSEVHAHRNKKVKETQSIHYKDRKLNNSGGFNTKEAGNRDQKWRVSQRRPRGQGSATGKMLW